MNLRTARAILAAAEAKKIENPRYTSTREEQQAFEIVTKVARRRSA